ncbi:DUF6090 family protein [Flagellimonas sediminis]|uniref:Uncharacterized protein n=1 Tax=Flagellimonas sediminis TaxID=2696468 RepID=A0A6I5L2R2_9FLAO|nr:DUF6090 family protein [Allomuricauda sediminis]NDV43991.1 hypothetical protein [Allomuricauda sediminis]
MKLFRKIRQGLIAESKLCKYVIYALGEILLVVLGILIALRINNWNENQQLRKAELQTLKSLHESIKINLDELDLILEAQVHRNRSLQEVLFSDVSNRKLVYLDSLITTNVENYTFDPSTGIYNAIINSGKIEIITNDSLRNRISKLYDRVADYQEIEDEVTEFTKDHLEKNFIENLSIDPSILAKIRKRTPAEKQKDSALYRETFDSQRLKNMYILLLNKMNVVITKGESLEAEYQSLIADLENEIQSKE